MMGSISILLLSTLTQVYDWKSFKRQIPQNKYYYIPFPTHTSIQMFSGWGEKHMSTLYCFLIDALRGSSSLFPPSTLSDTPKDETWFQDTGLCLQVEGGY